MCYHNFTLFHNVSSILCFKKSLVSYTFHNSIHINSPNFLDVIIISVSFYVLMLSNNDIFFLYFSYLNLNVKLYEMYVYKILALVYVEDLLLYAIY